MRGSELFLRCLSQVGVTHIVGNPGTTELAWMDNLPLFPSLRYVLALHEDIAVGMADGYSMASGRLGVVSVHATPGTAHALGNLFNASVAGTPLVVIVGQQEQQLLVREPFLASRVEETLRPYTKWCWSLTRAGDLPLAIHRAFKAAADPPPGPVALVVPRDLYEEDVSREFVLSLEEARPSEPQVMLPAPEAIELAADLLVQADSPAMICGPGVGPPAGVDVVLDLVRELGLSVYSDPRYPLVFPTWDEHYVGIFRGFPPGQHDVVLVVGQRVFLERTSAQVPLLPQETLLIHSDSNPWEIGKNYTTKVPLPGAPRATCEALLKSITRRRRDVMIRGRLEDRDRHTRILHREWRAQRETDLRSAWDRRPISAQRLAAELDQALPADAVLVVEAPTHDAFLRDHCGLRPGRLWFSGVGGALGWGVPAALGVKLASPRRLVVAVVGDGSFLYYPQALWTARRYDLPIVVVVCNNGSYLNDKLQLQARKGPAAVAEAYDVVDLTNPAVDYHRLSRAFDVSVRSVDDPDDLRDALLWALGEHQAALVEVRVDPWQGQVG